MLRLRVITALILAPLIIWSVLAFSHRALAIELGLILTVAAWEWARLAGLQANSARIAFGGFMALIMLGVMVLLHHSMQWLTWFLYANLLWWCIAFVLVASFRTTPEQLPRHFDAVAITLNLLAGIVIIGGAFVALTGLHRIESHGAYYILMLLVLIWLADIAAYFAGRRFGKHKLAPYVSPGKTWEGVLGAAIAVLLAALLIAGYLQLDTNKTILFSLLVLVTIAVSILGDLTESLFKRRVGVKDSSQLLPGHGGILDRIDSLMAAAPVFLLGMIQAGIR
ncbi:MAG: phosphatidate cytidylyltransferase [Gammaproteobacteria bacterium]|nr:phosphatidate cytidylyltransferase [Gammaproteobacteria bacterium]